MNTTETARDLVARAAARKAAFLAAASQRRGKHAPAGPVTTTNGVVRRMADDMLDIAAVKGSVDEEDLLLRGWTLTAIRDHGPAATDMANASAMREAA